MDKNAAEARFKIESSVNGKQDHGEAIEETISLIENLTASVQQQLNLHPLDTAISLLQTTLKGGKHVGAHRAAVKALLAVSHSTRYGLYGWIEDLDACLPLLLTGEGMAIIFAEEQSVRDLCKSIQEVQLATQHIKECRNSIDTDVLDTIICVAGESASVYTNDTSSLAQAKLLIELGRALVMKYLKQGDMAILEQAKIRFQEALGLCGCDVPVAYICLMSITHIGWLRFMESEYQMEGLLEVSYHLKKAEAIDMAGHATFKTGVGILRGPVGESQLQEAITSFTISLQHRVSPHPRRSMTLSNLANALFNRFDLKGVFQDLENSILFNEELLALRPKSHPDRSGSLCNLACGLFRRFENLGSLQDLQDCIMLHREALESEPNPDCSSLSNLAAYLLARYQQQREYQDLEEAIGLMRKSVSMTPSDHEDRPTSCNNLSNALFVRFQQTGVFQDMEECLELLREALDLEPAPHPGRYRALHDMATTLITRFAHKGIQYDLDEAILLFREALSLRSASCQREDQCSLLTSLGNALSIRFKQRHSAQDLEECIESYREALDLRPAPHPHRAVVLNNLASTLSGRFAATHDFKDLEDAIALLREALDLQSVPQKDRSTSLHTLAIALSRRSELRSEPKDAEEAISLYQQALALLPTPHPDRQMILHNLAQTLLKRFEHQGDNSDLQDALQYWESASCHTTGSLIDRLGSSKRWARCAQKYRPESALRAYQYGIGLLPLLASLDLTLEQRQEALTHAQELASDAAKCAILQNQFEMAIVILSSSRSTFWSQALQLRTPLDHLSTIDPNLANKLSSISRQLERASHASRDHAHNSTPITCKGQQFDAKFNTSLYTLAETRQKILDEIRKIEGLERFLLPLPFSSLQLAARGGTVILLTATGLGCDALIMHEAGAVHHIPILDLQSSHLAALKMLIEYSLEESRSISNPQAQVAAQTLRTILPRDMINVTLEPTASTQATFQLVLECLWIVLVQPVIEALGIEKTDLPGRIWWCPTGAFTSLPIHAAGMYSDDGEPIDCLFEYAISSYCTSPQDLLHSPPHIPTGFQMTAIIEPEAAGAGLLPAALKELDNIEKCIPDREQLIARLGLRSAPNSIDEILSDIEQSSFVHFGCHGTQNLTNPLESFLLLSGGKLTMSRIIQGCQVREGALAYLSACETAKGDEERPDESLNLVATMMFAGFRSVVGTMWSIYDADAPLVADVFYGHLFRDGKDAVPDVRDAAYGLHLATKKLRESGRSFSSWVPYVHYGI